MIWRVVLFVWICAIPVGLWAIAEFRSWRLRRRIERRRLARPGYLHGRAEREFRC